VYFIEHVAFIDALRNIIFSYTVFTRAFCKITDFKIESVFKIFWE